MGVDAPHGDVDATGEKASIEKGVEDDPRNPLLVRAHRAARKGRTISQADNTRRLQGRVV